MKYYVYRHIRLDTGETFYIGIGKVPTFRKKELQFNSHYSRAFERSKRSTFWKSIVAKTKYNVEIIFESDDLDLIKDTEIELIKIFGRRDLGLGSLVNHTDGGDNSANCKKYFNIGVEQYDLDGNFIKSWEQLKYIEEETGWLKTNIVKCCKQKQLSAYGYLWKYINDDSLLFISPKLNKSFYKKIKIFDKKTNALLGIFDSLKEASLFFNKNEFHMSYLLNNPNYKNSQYRVELSIIDRNK